MCKPVSPLLGNAAPFNLLPGEQAERTEVEEINEQGLVFCFLVNGDILKNQTVESWSPKSVLPAKS